jgi:hypothetical protein
MIIIVLAPGHSLHLQLFARKLTRESIAISFGSGNPRKKRMSISGRYSFVCRKSYSLSRNMPFDLDIRQELADQEMAMPGSRSFANLCTPIEYNAKLMIMCLALFPRCRRRKRFHNLSGFHQFANFMDVSSECDDQFDRFALSIGRRCSKILK